MIDSGDGYFVGAMRPQSFLDNFMDVTDELSTVPEVDFSGVLSGESVQSMCGTFVQIVESVGLCPNIRLYEAKTTRLRDAEESKAECRDPSIKGNRTQRSPRIAAHYACPAIAARRRPPSKRMRKRTAVSSTRRKPLDSRRYYDFATNLLDIEVVHDIDADPFEDPPESISSREPSTGSPSASSSYSLKRYGVTVSLTSPSARSTIHPGPSLPLHAPANNGANSLVSDKSTGLKPGTPPEDRSGPSSLKVASANSSSRYTSFERSSIEAKAFRTRLVSHARAEFARQHRVFLFQIVLINRYVRFIRWDHSGAVVSEIFDYVDNSGILAEFLWRFDRMSDEQRGLDPTVKLASLREKSRFEVAVNGFLKNAKTGLDGAPPRKLPGAERTLDETKTYPTWKINVTDSATRSSTNLIVRRPFSDHSSMWGRDTRAYLAYDLEKSRLVFLKDTWRMEHSKLRSESKTYRELARHGVPHIPSVLYGGDVRGSNRRPQETISQDFAEEEDPWRITVCELQKHIHHRIVQEIAYPLGSAVDEREFMQALHDALHAIDKAYSSAGLLHRDVSYGNVMITPEGRGVLNDWDHAGPKDELSRGIGTWAFMSIPLLRDPQKLHDLIDDLESVFWVLLYGALKRFVPPSQPSSMEMFEEERIGEDKYVVGGRQKNHCLAYGGMNDMPFTNPALQTLIRECAARWNAYHRAGEGALGFRSPETKASIMALLDFAPQPSYWIERFDSALNADVTPGLRLGHQTSSLQDTHASLKRKRQASNAPQTSSTYVPPVLRRSKRLKNVH